MDRKVHCPNSTYRHLGRINNNQPDRYLIKSLNNDENHSDSQTYTRGNQNDRVVDTQADDTDNQKNILHTYKDSLNNQPDNPDTLTEY